MRFRFVLVRRFTFERRGGKHALRARRKQRLTRPRATAARARGGSSAPERACAAPSRLALALPGPCVRTHCVPYAGGAAAIGSGNRRSPASARGGVGLRSSCRAVTAERPWRGARVRDEIGRAGPGRIGYGGAGLLGGGAPLWVGGQLGSGPAWRQEGERAAAAALPGHLAWRSRSAELSLLCGISCCL